MYHSLHPPSSHLSLLRTKAMIIQTLCTPTVAENSSGTTEPTLAFVVAPSYILITAFVINSPFFRVTILPPALELYPRPSPDLKKHRYCFLSFCRYSCSVLTMNKASTFFRQLKTFSFYRLVPPHLFSRHLAYLFHPTLIDKVPSHFLSNLTSCRYNFNAHLRKFSCLPSFHGLDSIYSLCMGDLFFKALYFAKLFLDRFLQSVLYASFFFVIASLTSSFHHHVFASFLNVFFAYCSPHAFKTPSLKDFRRS